MKYCRNCGRELVDDAVICPECGTSQESARKSGDAALKGGLVGFLLSFFLGLIGLILALCLGDAACKKAAKTTFFVCLGVYVVIIVLYVVLILGAADALALL